MSKASTASTAGVGGTIAKRTSSGVAYELWFDGDRVELEPMGDGETLAYKPVDFRERVLEGEWYLPSGTQRVLAALEVDDVE